MKNRLKKTVVLLLTVGLYFLSVKYGAELQHLRNIYLAFLNEDEYTGEDAEQLIEKFLEDGMVPAVIYGIKSNVLIENEGFQRSESVNVIEYVGAANLIFPECSGIDTEENAGCYIDVETATTLFGDSDIEGNVVSVDGNEYIIRQVVKDAMGTVLMPMKRDGSEKVSEIRVRKREDQSYQEIERMLNVQYGVSGQRINLEALCWINCMLLIAVPLVGFIELIYIGIKDVTCDKWYISILVKIVICACVLILGVSFLSDIFFVPKGMVVHGFSEFEMWIEEITEKRMEGSYLVQIGKTTSLLKYWKYFWKSFFCWLGTVFILSIVKIQKSIKKNIIQDRL